MFFPNTDGTILRCVHENPQALLLAEYNSPNQMKNSAKKVADSGNDKIIFTERGTSFGYGNLWFACKKSKNRLA